MKNVDDQVLEFYTSLPFNIYEDPGLAIENIKNFNLKNTYPFLVDDVNAANLRKLYEEIELEEF